MEAIWISLGDKENFFDDTPMPATAGAKELCIVKRESQVYALSDWCTHGSARLSDGYLEGEDVECPFHQGRFNLKTGQPTRAPAEVAATVYDTKIENGEIFVRVPQTK